MNVQVQNNVRKHCKHPFCADYEIFAAPMSFILVLTIGRGPEPIKTTSWEYYKNFFSDFFQFFVQMTNFAKKQYFGKNFIQAQIGSKLGFFDLTKAF